MVQDVASYKASNLTLERRVHAAVKEAAHAAATKSELEESVKSTKRELACLQRSMAVKEERDADEVQRYGKELAQSESRLKTQLASVNVLLIEEREKSKVLERQCLDIQEVAKKQISDLAKDLNQEDDSKAKLLFAKDQLMKYENTITELQRELGHTHQNHQNEIQRLQHACEVCHKDLNLVLFEKKEMDKTIAADKIKVAQIQKLLEESETSVLKIENRYQSLESERTYLLKKIDDLNDENDELRHKVKCTVEEMRLLEEHESCRQKKAEGALKSEVGKMKQELEKEKRRSNAYKSKALESHRRNVQAKEALEELKILH